MKLDNETLDVLKNFATINPSLMFRKGSIQKTVSIHDSVIARAKLKQEFPADFAIYDLSNFISAVTMFSDSELSFEEAFVKISSVEAQAKIKYYYASEDLIIKSQYLGKEVKSVSSDISFTLTKDSLSGALKAVSILAVPEARIKGDGKKIAIEAVNPKNINSNLYRKVIAEGQREFEAYFKTENLNFLAADYAVQIMPPPNNKGTGIANFTSPLVDYWVATEQHSKF
jgi:hypothetical protein